MNDSPSAETQKPGFRFRWYHALALVGLLCLLLAAAASLFLFTRLPQIGQSAQGLGQSLGELEQVRAKVATRYGFDIDNVGVQINLLSQSQVGTSNTSVKRRLIITLVNTPLNSLTPEEQRARSREIARFAMSNYPHTDIDEYCTNLLQRNQVLIFSSTQTQVNCFSSAEL